jgi:hypothetical protein
MGITEEQFLRYNPLLGFTIDTMALTIDTTPKKRKTPDITLFKADRTESVTNGLNRLAPRILRRSTEKKVRNTMPRNK